MNSTCRNTLFLEILRITCLSFLKTTFFLIFSLFIQDTEVPIIKDEAGKLYYKETQKNYLKDEKHFETFILSKTAADSLNIKQSYTALVNPSVVDSIATKKSKLLLLNIETYLKTARDSTQIKIIISDPKEPENIGSKPILKIEFSMQEDV